MNKKTFDVCVLAIVMPVAFLTVSYGHEAGWMSSKLALYGTVIFCAGLLHFFVYRPVVKRYFRDASKN